MYMYIHGFVGGGGGHDIHVDGCVKRNVQLF